MQQTAKAADIVAQVEPIRPQAAPPPAAPPPPPAPKAPPDNSIGFALSKPALTVGILIHVVLALLLYVAGFFTALALLAPQPAVEQAAGSSPSGPAPATAPPAVATPAAPQIAAPMVTATGQPAGQQPPTAAATPGDGTAAAPSAGEREASAPAAPGSTETGSTETGNAETGSAGADSTGSDNAGAGNEAAATPAPEQPAPPPIPSRLADRASLLRAADGGLSLPPRPTLPPPSIILRRTADAAVAVADGAAAPERELPASVADARQLPPTRENALLAPTPARPAPPPGTLNWTLQAGAFLSQQHAERLVQILNGRGYNAHILVTRDSQDRSWYRVRFGDFSTRPLAADSAREFKRRENREVIVVRRLIDPAPAS